MPKVDRSFRKSGNIPVFVLMIMQMKNGTSFLFSPCSSKHRKHTGPRRSVVTQGLRNRMFHENHYCHRLRLVPDVHSILFSARISSFSKDNWLKCAAQFSANSGLLTSDPKGYPSPISHSCLPLTLSPDPRWLTHKPTELACMGIDIFSIFLLVIQKKNEKSSLKKKDPSSWIKKCLANFIFKKWK